MLCGRKCFFSSLMYIFFERCGKVTLISSPFFKLRHTSLQLMSQEWGDSHQSTLDGYLLLKIKGLIWWSSLKFRERENSNVNISMTTEQMNCWWSSFDSFWIRGSRKAAVSFTSNIWAAYFHNKPAHAASSGLLMEMSRWCNCILTKKQMQ